jgi:Uma2 family endonuclease
MTYTQPKPRTFDELLNYDDGSDHRYELTTTGELKAVPPESEENIFLAIELYEALKSVVSRRLIKTHTTTIQVNPVGDGSVNRYPDLGVLCPEHIDLMATARKNAIAFGMPAPRLIAEIVSPGNERSDNYQRDYVWKRQQYQDWGIPEYWIVDPQRAQVTVLALSDGGYEAAVYRDAEQIRSKVFPALVLTAEAVLKP